MTDRGEHTEEETQRGLRLPDPINLVVGLVTLVISGYVLSDEAFALPSNPRWWVAGAALLVGLLLLAASMRTSRRSRPSRRR